MGVLAPVALASQTTPPQTAAGQGAFSTPIGPTISGTVVTEAGQPIAGVAVRVISRLVQPGDPAVRYTTRSTVRTNARGEYRFSVLAAGDYIVDIPLTQTTMPASVVDALAQERSAAGPTSPLAQRLADSFAPSPYVDGARIGSSVFHTMSPLGPVAGPRPSNPAAVFVYPATIFQNASTTRNARIVTLRASEAFNAEFRLTAVRGHQVSGTLVGPASDVAHLGVRLLPEADDLELFRDVDFELASTSTDERGAFTFLGVPPGRYALKTLYVPSALRGQTGEGPGARVGGRGGVAPTDAALALVRWAESPVSVDAADVSGIQVPLHPPVRVSGRVDAGTTGQAAFDLSQATVSLVPNRPASVAPPLPVPVAADGTFAISLYGPGHYSVLVSGVPGATASAITVGGAPLTNRWLTIPARDLSGVMVKLSGSPLGRAAGPAGVAGSPPASAPPPPPNPDNAFVAGRVLDGTTNAPIQNATVVLLRAGATPDTRRVVTTDEFGAFSFGEATAGSYNVGATAAGYSPGSFGVMREGGRTSTLGLAARERVNAMVIRMWKPGVVSGRVVDEMGKGVAGLTVVSLQFTPSGLTRSYALRTMARTDATGAYRLAGLAPGEYAVCSSFTPTTIPESVQTAFQREQAVAGPGGILAALLAESRAPTPSPASVLIEQFRFLISSPSLSPAPLPAPISSTSGIATYRTTCYPAAATLFDAKTLTVQTGQDRSGVDLTLTAIATVRLSGIVRGPDGPIPNVGVRLIRASGPHEVVLGSERLEAGAAVSDEHGAFAFLGVSPGQYVIRSWTTHVSGEAPPAPPPIGRPAARPNGVMLWAEMPLAAMRLITPDIALALRPTARVTGRLVFVGSGAPPSPSQFSISLATPQQFDPPLPLPAPVQADGSFSLRGYAPGRYRLPETAVGAWRIVSATLDGKLLPNHAIDLGVDDVSNLVLTATDQFTTLSGVVAPEPGLGPIAATVCIFPADYKGWFADDMTPTRVRSFRPSGTWTYTATWLPAGDYLAVVYREAEGDDLTPAFVERLAKLATPVTLHAGEKTTMNLAIVTIR
jgi:protocatechuate 3,4-dioxygenase beta subunit